MSGLPASLRVLITNTALVNRAGSELYVRDLALELKRRGHDPVVYSPRIGEVGRSIRRAGVPVVDDLAAIGTPPDIVHGQHHLETMAALAHFPGVPAIYVCHGRLPWEELPPVHPRIVRYVAVSRIVHEHVASVEGIEPGRVTLLGNFVDTARFRPRGPLPAAPRRALLFDNHASEDGYVPAIRRACAREGIALDVVGLYSGNAASEPERILGGYDVVFSRGRAALESLAVGAAVVVCGKEGAGPMVTRANLARLLEDNFGMRAMSGAITEVWASDVLRAYDAADATAVAEAVREGRSLDAAAGELVALYREAIAEWGATGRRLSREEAARAEMLAAARYGRWLSLSVGEQLQRAADVAAGRDDLARQVEQLRGELARMRGSLTWKLYERATRARALRRAYRLVAAPFKRDMAKDELPGATAAREPAPPLPPRRPLAPGEPELACVVMSVGNPPSLVVAVRSLLAQDEPAEIVVVNSGGGGAASTLRAAGIDGVKVVEREELLWPGAARNEGILATRAPWVAFLAADCVAEPGWISGRLARHRAGALAVSSAVTNLARGSAAAWAAHVALFSTRMPGLAADDAVHYGLSYDRRLFDRFGLFREDLRTGEDTELNERMRGVALEWAPEVRSAHAHPVTLRGLLADQRARGRRMAAVLRSLRGRRGNLVVARNAIGRIPSSLRAAWRGSLPGERTMVAAAAPLLLPAAASYALGALGARAEGGEPAVPPRRRHRIIALLAARNEAETLPSWLANVAPQVDGIVALDDGSTDATAAILAAHPAVLEVVCIPSREPHAWDEPRNRRLLVEAALRHGAEWMIVVDADERLEARFRERAEDEIVRAGREGHLAYRVTMRELWNDPRTFRVDGVWGDKRPPRFFRARADHEFDERPFHGWWAPLNSMPGGDCAAADLVIYHLRMIRAEDRLARRRRYEELDPDAVFQEIGYAYLTDETGLVVEPLPRDATMSRWLERLGLGPSHPPAPFVVGVARSGTTLLRLMLDAHPEMSIPPESYVLLPFLRRPARELSSVDAAEFCRVVTGFHTWPDLGVDAGELAREVAALRRFTLGDATRAVYRLHAAKRGKTRWGDKTPSYAAHIEGIERILPEARFVHIVRDGRDVALSLRAQWFAPASDVEGLARHWAGTVRATRAAGARTRHYLELRYEDLVRDPRRTLEELCRFVELRFDEAMLDYHRGAEARLGEVGDQKLPDGRVITREARLGKHRLAGAPPDASRIGVWREEMSAADRAAFESVAGELLRELGYEA